MNILGIETSCDETASAVVRDGRDVLSNVVHTQIPLHQPYGGVVPEVASRAHIEKIGGIVKAAMECGASIDAVACTYGPGLASSLLVGFNAAKGLSLSLNVPLIAINHIEAHLHAPFLKTDETQNVEGPDDIESCMPAVGLAVSGGHTTWIDMPSYGKYLIIGQTLDDAAGEAFDKAAKMLGLGYPGGPVIDRWAKGFWNGATDFSDADTLKAMCYPDDVRLRPGMIHFPSGRPRAGTAALAGLPPEMCVSFSGLKTSLARTMETNPPSNDIEKASLAAAYQEAIVSVIADRTRTALSRHSCKTLVVGGGVSLNGRLRTELAKVANEAGVELRLSAPKFCGDNAAMVAGLAYFRRNLTGQDAMTADIMPSLDMPLAGA